MKSRQSDVRAITTFIQERLRIDRLDLVTAVEANRWLEKAGLLSDDKSRPGKPLRNLLRQRLIAGAWQDPPRDHGRWFISRLGTEAKATHISPHLAPDIERLPPSLRSGIDIAIIGERPGKKSLAAGCYYADPTNSFWRDLHVSGFTPRLFEPCEYAALLDLSPSIGLDDLYDDAKALTKRLKESKPTLLVLNSKRVHAGLRRDESGRALLQKFECAVLFDSSGQAQGWHNERLNQLRELRERFGRSQH